MKKFTTVAVIAALALATQAFAMGVSTKSGKTMPTTMSTITMKTATTMATGTQTMTSTAPMSGAGTMTSTMPTTGMTKPQMTPGTPMQPAAAK